MVHKETLLAAIKQLSFTEKNQELDRFFDQVLIGPVEDFLTRPSKKIRGELVTIGFSLSGSSVQKNPQLCELGAEIVESLHAGSLIVDDIQDGSSFRRGKPALHHSYGVPVALNAGNWLYFWPFERIRSLQLSPADELKIYQLCHRALMRAHFGQALDVGVSIDQLSFSEIDSVCRASLELKTGALIALAISLGGVLGGAQDEHLEILDRFGHRFGISLQMFDDIGNIDSQKDRAKRREDLALRRPSWLWSVLVRNFDRPAFDQFLEAVKTIKENPEKLDSWLTDFPLIQRARNEASEYLDDAVSELLESLCRSGVDVKDHVIEQMKDIQRRLTRAYH